MTAIIKGATFGKGEEIAGHEIYETYVDCIFKFYDFRYKRLRGRFINCQMYLANFTQASIMNCEFVNCDLRNAYFNNATFDRTIFRNCKLEATSWNGSHGRNNCSFIHDGGANTTVGLLSKESVGKPYSFIHSYPSKKNKPKKEKLIEPKILPPVAHYRSKPALVPESKVDFVEAEDYDEWELYGAYYMGYDASGESRYEYGYLRNAVLECNDIDVLESV